MGVPFSVYYSAQNFSGTNNGPNGGPGLDRPNVVGDPVVAHPTTERWFNVDAFEPPNNTFGNAGRNILRGDGLNNVDLALCRNMRIGDATRLQFRLEVFNLFNTPHFFLPIGDLSSASAGRVVRALDGRQLQLGVRVDF